MVKNINGNLEILKTDLSNQQSGSVNETTQVFDYAKYSNKLTYPLNTLRNIQKKHNVKQVGVFSANMTDSMSFGSKIKQFFENIKLKFWDASKSISKDCEKLANVLTDATAEAIRKGNAECTMEAIFKIVNDEINKLLSDKTKVSMYKNEKDNATIEQHLQDVSKLQEQIKTLKVFLGHGYNLNKFDAFHKEPTQDDIEYAREAAKLYNRPFNEEGELQKMQTWQQKQFEDLKSAKAFLNENEEHDLKSVLNEKIAQIEDRVLGGNRIRRFYDDLEKENTGSKELASSCNALVKYLKSIEKWLRSADPKFNIDENAFAHRIWRENLMYEFDTNVVKERYDIEKHPKNDDIEKDLQTYVNDHPETRIVHYRGIPYIADQSGKPVSIE